MIRARSRQHLDTLKGRFAEQLGEYEIIETSSADYPWRLICPKAVCAECVRALVLDMAYDNFKEACVAIHGANTPYVQALGTTWETFARLKKRRTILLESTLLDYVFGMEECDEEFQFVGDTSDQEHLLARSLGMRAPDDWDASDVLSHVFIIKSIAEFHVCSLRSRNKRDYRPPPAKRNLDDALRKFVQAPMRTTVIVAHTKYADEVDVRLRAIRTLDNYSRYRAVGYDEQFVWGHPRLPS
ncbi:hypothetical protein KJ567_00085 [Candidatus Bipolaricaulota bacterium]|nr:hypothetical protein [Candidatus Bipolaricaulota bacterium]